MKAVFFLFCAIAVNALAAEMSEIRFQDQDPDQSVYTSRILVLEERLRMDYGNDGEDFILFDRRAGMVWLVSHADRRITGIPARPMKQVVKMALWPKGWKLDHDLLDSGTNALNQVRLNGQLCVEFKNAPILKDEARLLRDFRRALAGNQADAWNGTPESMRQPCSLVVDVHLAGLEYQQGLPLAIRYWDGRSRIYQSHATHKAQAALFELPENFQRFVIGKVPEDKTGRQPGNSTR
jgi:hypothetical protein